MKNNKKIMSVVAGVCISSQLLTGSSIVANAQAVTDKIFTHNHMDLSTTNYGNTIQIFDECGQNGLQMDFDVKRKKIKVKVLNGSDGNKPFDKKNENKDYLNIRLLKNDGGLDKEFIFKGGDHISKLVKDINDTEFKVGYKLSISINSNNSSVVKISGYVGNTASCFEKGIDTDRLKRSYYTIGDSSLSVQENDIRKTLF